MSTDGAEVDGNAGGTWRPGPCDRYPFRAGPSSDFRAGDLSLVRSQIDTSTHSSENFTVDESGHFTDSSRHDHSSRIVDKSTHTTKIVLNERRQEDIPRPCPICGDYNRDVALCFKCPACSHEFICKAHRVQAGARYLCQACASPKKTNWEQLIGEARAGSTEAGVRLRSFSLSLLDKVYEEAFSGLFDFDTARALMRKVITQTLERHEAGDVYPTCLRMRFRTEVCHQLARASQAVAPKEESADGSAWPAPLASTLDKLENCIRRLPVDRRLALQLDGCGMAPEEIGVLIPDPPARTLLMQARAAILNCLEQRSHG